MNIIQFDITGRVIDGSNEQGIPNLKVEAWDKDIKYNDLLGSTITNSDGFFEISFDSTYFREYSPDLYPELFFKVYAGKKLLKSTEDAPIKNAKAQEDVTITLNSVGKVRSEGKDRVSTEQFFKAAEFFNASDFKGVYNQYRDKIGGSFGFVSDMVTNSIKKFDFKPLQPKVVQQGDTIVAANEKLEARQITVESVEPYNPTLDRASIKSFSLIPPDLEPGQRVTLYEEDGKVKYYSVAKEDETGPARSSADKKLNNDNRLQLKKLQEDLTQTKKIIDKKDEQIISLQKELKNIMKDHEDIKSIFKSDAFTQFMKANTKPAETKKAVPTKKSPAPKTKKKTGK